MSLLQVKKADNRIKLIIFGYSRRSATELSIQIPQMIQYLFILYYWIQEKFTDYGDYLKLDDSSNIVTNISKNITEYDWNTIYGNHVINVDDTSISEYTWKIKILTLSTNIWLRDESLAVILNRPELIKHTSFSDSIMMGLDSTNIRTNLGITRVTSYITPHSLFYYDGESEISSSEYKSKNLKDEIAVSLKCNDIIELKVNIKNKKLIFYKNNIMIDEPITFTGYENNNYNFAISLNTSTSIQLIEFVAK